MNREAWFCPTCQRHHAPHVDTCPAPATFGPATVTTIPNPVQPWPQPSTGTPLTPWNPLVGTCQMHPFLDPAMLIVNGVANTRAQ